MLDIVNIEDFDDTNSKTNVWLVDHRNFGRQQMVLVSLD